MDEADIDKHIVGLILANQYTLNPGDADPELAENEVEMQRKTNLETGIVTLYTVVFTDANNDGIADYLDENTY